MEEAIASSVVETDNENRTAGVFLERELFENRALAQQMFDPRSAGGAMSPPRPVTLRMGRVG